MSIRSASFAANAGRLLLAAEALVVHAGIVDAVATSTPAVVPTVLVEGVARPVEDLVVARETFGIHSAVDTTRRYMIQAVLNAEAAIVAAGNAISAFESAGQ